MANENEVALVGWTQISGIFGRNERFMRKRKEELLEAGVIFYMKVGTPPNRRVAAFPSILKKWAALKAQRGEFI